MDSFKLKHFVKRYWILLLLVSIKMGTQSIVVNPVYELHRDEFLHLNQADHLAFGFISVPPLTSLFAALIYALGGGLFWIRFFPALFGALTIVFTWLIVEELHGKTFAKILVSCALIFSAFTRVNILFQPNSFDILAWTMVYFFLIKYIKTEKLKWILFLFFSGVLGLYNKYNILFLFIGLLISIIPTVYKNLFTRKDFWLIVILALVLLTPNIAWQIKHHFPVLMHMQALSTKQLANNSAIGFLQSQVIILFGSIPLVIAALIALSSYNPFKSFRVVGLSFVVTIIIFACLKAKAYYSLGLYPVLFAFGGVYLERLLSVNWLRLIRPMLILYNFLLFLFIGKYLFPILSPGEIVENKEMLERIGLLRWEDGKVHPLPQDFSDMLGWKEMAEKAGLAFKTIPANEQDKTIIFCDNYGQCGALNYYNRGKGPESYSFNTDYIYWLPRLDTIQNIVLVGQEPDKKITGWFTECKYFGQVESEYSREKGTSIFLLTGSKPGFTVLFYQIADERKKEFDIF